MYESSNITPPHRTSRGMGGGAFIVSTGPNNNVVSDTASEEGTLPVPDGVEVRPFTMPGLTEEQELMLQGSILAAPTIESADENVISFLTYTDSNFLPEDGIPDYSTYHTKCLFVSTLLREKLAPGSEIIGLKDDTLFDSIKRTYERLLGSILAEAYTREEYVEILGQYVSLRQALIQKGKLTPSESVPGGYILRVS